MKRILLSAAACGVLLLSCASASFAPEEPRPIPRDVFGMAHAGFRVSPEEYGLLDELGAVWMRRTFQWQRIQPRQDVWDFALWDAYVDSGLRAGKKILAVLAYDAGWIHGADEPPRRTVLPHQLEHYLRYVEAVATRYRGRIGAYEIWNEPNWTFWRGTPEDFYALSRAAARKIREIDPAAKIVAGSFQRVPELFIRGMFESGAMEYADAVSFHPYAVTPRGTVGLFDRLRRILDGHGFRGEIWVTEVGYPTGGWYATRVSEEDLPSHVVKTLAGLAARGSRTIFWYEVFDKHPRGRAPSRTDSGLHFGLAYPDYARKAGAAAYALFARHAAGAAYRPDLVERRGLPPSLTAMLFRADGASPDGRSALVLWNDGEETPVRIRLPGRNRRIHDIAKAGAGEAAGETVDAAAGEVPVFLTWEEDPAAPGAGRDGRVVVEALL